MSARDLLNDDGDRTEYDHPYPIGPVREGAIPIWEIRD